MQSIIKVFTDFALETGFAAFFTQPGAWKYAVMIVVACFLLYLAIVKKFEPLLLLPIAFGMLLTNLPGAGVQDCIMPIYFPADMSTGKCSHKKAG